MRSPVVAIAAVLLAGLMLLRMRTDLSYALAPRTPHELGDVRAALDKGLFENQYVRMHGHPDRANAVFLDTRGKDEFRQLFRLLGTNSRVIVLRTFGTLSNAQASADVFEGRLVDLHSISFMDSVRAYFEKRMTGARFLDPEQLGRQVRETTLPAHVADLAGDEVALSHDSELTIEIRYPDEYKFVLSAPRFTSLEAGREALADAGVLQAKPDKLPVSLPGPPSHLLVTGRPPFFMRATVRDAVAKLVPGIEVTENPDDPGELYISVPVDRYPGGFDQLKRALSNVGLATTELPPVVLRGRIPPARRDGVLASLEALEPSIVVTPRHEVVRRTVRALKAQPDQIPWPNVERVSVPESLRLPSNAFVLVEGETPRSFLYVPVLYGLLGLILAYNLYALWTALYRLMRAGRMGRAAS